MRAKYLGDCLDFFKRWFLSEFFPGERLAAWPMRTDIWGPGERDTYAQLLGVEVVQDQIFPNEASRADYFRNALGGVLDPRDFFLDPDTGLRVDRRPPAGKRFDEYLFADELADALLPPGSRRVAVIYDQSISRGSELESASRKVQLLRARGLYAFAYCAQVAMFVVSRDPARIARLYRRAIQLAHVPKGRIASSLTQVDLEGLPDDVDHRITMKPPAELSGTPTQLPRLAGMHAGAFEVGEDFDQPLPDDFWTGRP